MRIPTMKQLETYGTSAGYVLDSVERETYEAVRYDQSSKAMKWLSRRLSAINARRAEFFNAKPE